MNCCSNCGKKLNDSAKKSSQESNLIKTQVLILELKPGMTVEFNSKLITVSEKI